MKTLEYLKGRLKLLQERLLKEDEQEADDTMMEINMVNCSINERVNDTFYVDATGMVVIVPLTNLNI